MKHARPDYDRIQDTSETARQLAELILSMGMVTEAGITARALAREILGLTQLGPVPQVITTNGTTRIIPADEPVFLLRAQDVNAADTVRHWAALAEARGADPGIVDIARKHADLMDQWPHKKTPDLPYVPTT